MKKKSKADRIPKWAWLLLSFVTAMIVWYLLSLNPQTARSFPNVVKVIQSLPVMIERGVFWQDIRQLDLRDSRFCDWICTVAAGGDSDGMVCAGAQHHRAVDPVHP